MVQRYRSWCCPNTSTNHIVFKEVRLDKSLPMGTSVWGFGVFREIGWLASSWEMRVIRSIIAPVVLVLGIGYIGRFLGGIESNLGAREEQRWRTTDRDKRNRERRRGNKGVRRISSQVLRVVPDEYWSTVVVHGRVRVVDTFEATETHRLSLPGWFGRFGRSGRFRGWLHWWLFCIVFICRVVVSRFSVRVLEVKLLVNEHRAIFAGPYIGWNRQLKQPISDCCQRCTQTFLFLAFCSNPPLHSPYSDVRSTKTFFPVAWA